MSISDADLTARLLSTKDGPMTRLQHRRCAMSHLAPATRSANANTAVGVGDAWPRGRPV